MKGHFWHLRYPIEGTDKSIVVATTRPETMLGDTAVAVHPDDERYKDLVGTHIILPLVGRRIPIVADTYSDPERHRRREDHAGATSTTSKWASVTTCRCINIFDSYAKMNDNVPEQYRGLDRFVARKQVVADLEAAGVLVKVEDHTLQVPYGDRNGNGHRALSHRPVVSRRRDHVTAVRRSRRSWAGAVRAQALGNHLVRVDA